MKPSSLLSETRHRAGLSQGDLAARGGTSQSTLSRYESGAAVPTIATLERLMAAAGAQLLLGAVASPRQADFRRPRLHLLHQHKNQIRAVLSRHGMRNVSVFGSVARGTDTPDSDIDLLVDFDVKKFGLFPVQDAAAELSTILHEKFNVTVRSLVKSTVSETIARDEVPL